MTRQESLVMKGIAILLMLWLHLFNMQTPLYSPLFYIGDNPVERYLTCLTKPVGFFCFLSGYGMHVLYEKGKDTLFQMPSDRVIIQNALKICNCKI